MRIWCRPSSMRSSGSSALESTRTSGCLFMGVESLLSLFEYFRTVLLFRVAGDLNHNIFCRTVAHILDCVHGAEGHVDDAARPGAFGFAVVVKLQCSLLDNDQLRVLNLVQRGRHRSGRLHGLMRTDRLARGQRSVENHAVLGAIRRGQVGRASCRERGTIWVATVK